MSRRRGVFVSYSHKDKDWVDRLRVALLPILQGEAIDFWSDSRIEAGTEWRPEIEQAITSARVAILLVSANYLGSSFVFETELPLLLEQRKTGMTVLWLPISSSGYKFTALNQIQAAWEPERPLDTLPRAKQQIALVAMGERVKNAMDLNAIADALSVVDRFSVEQDAYLQRAAEPPRRIDYGVMARQDEEAIRFEDRNGQQLTVLHAEDLRKLDSRSQQLIRTYERTMEDLFDLWTELYRKCYSRDNIVRDRARAEAGQVRNDLCVQLNNILDFVRSLSGYLNDHYEYVRQVCEKKWDFL